MGLSRVKNQWKRQLSQAKCICHVSAETLPRLARRSATGRLAWQIVCTDSVRSEGGLGIGCLTQDYGKRRIPGLEFAAGIAEFSA